MNFFLHCINIFIKDRKKYTDYDNNMFSTCLFKFKLTHQQIWYYTKMHTDTVYLKFCMTLNGPHTVVNLHSLMVT